MNTKYFYNFPTGGEVYKWYEECYAKGCDLMMKREYSEALYYLMRAAIGNGNANAYIAYCFQYGLGVERNVCAAEWYYTQYERPGMKMRGWILEHYTKLLPEVKRVMAAVESEPHFSYSFFDRDVGLVEVFQSRIQKPTVTFSPRGVRVHKSLSRYEESPMQLIIKTLENRDYYRSDDNLGALYDGFSRDYPLFKVTIKYDNVPSIQSAKRDGRYWISVPRDLDFRHYGTREYLIDYAKRLMLKEAKVYLTPRVALMSQQTGLLCSNLLVNGNRNYLGRFYPSKKHMELTFHLMKSSPEFVDAVIVHELSHIFSLSHDDKFYEGFEQHSSKEMVNIDKKHIGYSPVYDI